MQQQHGQQRVVAFLSNCLVQPERMTINQTLLDFASSRGAIAAGVQSKQRHQTREDDLGYLASGVQDESGCPWGKS
jgi:hypothetical protein